MNGLEAIKLMEQGSQISDGEYVYKIENGLVLLRRIDCTDGGFKIDNGFDFTSTYKEYIEPKSLIGWERAGQSKDKFYYISATEEIMRTNDDCYLTNQMHEKANYFSTKEKAEETSFKQTLFRRLQRFSDENGRDKIDWKDEKQMKFFIRYNHDKEMFHIDYYWRLQEFGIVYFISREVAEQAIELFHDELIKYFVG